jgi:hypothetical protein
LTIILITVSVLALTVLIRHKRAVDRREDERITRLIYNNAATRSRRTKDAYRKTDWRQLNSLGQRRWVEVVEAQHRPFKLQTARRIR